MHQISETIAISLMLPMHQISYCSDFFSIAGKQSLPIIKKLAKHKYIVWKWNQL